VDGRARRATFSLWAPATGSTRRPTCRHSARGRFNTLGQRPRQTRISSEIPTRMRLKDMSTAGSPSVLTLSGGYAFEFLDADGSPAVTTHTPLVDGSYPLTRTLTASAAAGPQIATAQSDSSLGLVGSSQHRSAIPVRLRGPQLRARPGHHRRVWHDRRNRYRLRPNINHEAETGSCLALTPGARPSLIQTRPTSTRTACFSWFSSAIHCASNRRSL